MAWVLTYMAKKARKKSNIAPKATQFHALFFQRQCCTFFACRAWDDAPIIHLFFFCFFQLLSEYRRQFGFFIRFDLQIETEIDYK